MRQMRQQHYRFAHLALKEWAANAGRIDNLASCHAAATALGVPHETHALLRDGMGNPRGRGVAWGRVVREHHVESVRLEGTQQIAHVARTHDHFHVVEPQHGFQETQLEVA